MLYTNYYLNLKERTLMNKVRIELMDDEKDVIVETNLNFREKVQMTNECGFIMTPNGRIDNERIYRIHKV